MSNTNDDVIIVGSLDDKALKQSINELVEYVDRNTSEMASSFVVSMDMMKGAMKDFAVTQKVSVDLMKQAWREMSSSFDAMVAAQSQSTGGSGGSGGSNATPDSVKALKEDIAAAEQMRDTLQQWSPQLYAANEQIEKMRNNLNSMLAKGTLKEKMADARKELGDATSMPTKNLGDAQRKLATLEALQQKYKNTTLLSVQQTNRLATAIQTCKDKIDKLTKTKPQKLSDVLGMDENSFDSITKKMSALKKLTWSDDNEKNTIIANYQRLREEQNKLLSSNAKMARSNNYLAQSFGYIRNRIAYALTLGTATSIGKQIYEIRGQYELLERSLGVLVNSFQKGSEIFQELNNMAIKSPFTLMELAGAAKQLTAYNFAANEVVDTTRRLADISSALGVPMERLTYNLGQIKAQGVLNARDARDFANAGLAIVPMLAKMYTEQKTFGDEMVTTTQVYDMMSKKMVTYSDVLKVLYRVTDEGGKFFDFQAKQADTLRVQMANLTLAYNNMLNEIGAENQGILSGMVGGLKTLLKHWRDIQRILLTLITTFGVYKTVSMLAVGAQTISAWISLARSIKSAKDAMALFNLTTSANPLGLLASVLAGVIGYFVLFKNEVAEVSREVEMFGESASKTISKVNTLKKVIDGTDDTSNTYKKTLSELSNIAKEYGVELDAEKARRDEINKAIEQTIQLIKEESAERQRANQLEQARSTYESETETARKELQETLAKSSNISGGGVDATYLNTIKENSEAIASIVDEVVTNNIHLIVNKSGEELEKGINDLYGIINTRLKKVGISGGDIQQILSGLLSSTSAVQKFAISIANANEKLERHGKIIEKNKQVADEATQATMTFTQKVDANARALRNNTTDAISLYNQIYDIVKIAKENHTITFDLELTAQKPPKWMLDKSLPELQQLAERFTAIAKSGGHAEGYNRESTYERGLMYASAARIKQEEEERKSRQKDKDTRTKQSDEIAKAIKNEISLVKQLQSAYDTLTKKGDSHANAIAKVQDLYGKTIDLLNKDMDKFGLPRLDLSIIKGNNHNEVLAFFEKLRDVLESKGLSNIERMEAVEGVVKEFRLKADTYNLDMITKGLNNELGKLKDEYELAVELDANPELGDMFADMFGINTKELPHTFGEAYDRANKIAKEKLNELKVDTKDFDLMSAVVKGDKDNKWLGLEITSQPVQDLIKNQKTWQDMFKKNMLDTEKMLDDYIKKYGDYSDKIAEIEAGRLEKLKKLNEAYYTEEMRKRPEYTAKLNAIEQGASKEKQQVDFDEFKNSRYYTMMFENLDYISTKTIRDMRDRVRELIDTMNDLTPEQLKTLMSQYEKLEQKLVKRSPFKTLTKDLKEYFATSKERKAANQEFKNAQKEYDAQKKNVAALKEKYEQAKANSNTSKSYLDFLQIEIGGENEILKILKEQLDAAQKKADKYNLTAKLAKSEALAVAQVVGQNLQSLGELRDFLQQDLGVELSDELNGLVDGLSKVGQGINKITSSATSGDIVGVITGVGQTVYGLFDGIASIFGGGSNNKKINNKIEQSELAVKRLENAYKSLSDTVENSYGIAEVGAQRVAIANKKLKLAELRRQLQLEKSRDAKDRDKSKIADLEGQIIDLELEIKNATNDIVNDLLGISSVGSAAESLVSSMIDSFKKGEDYMGVFADSFEDMIDNMIMKAIVSQVIGDRMQELFDKIKANKKDKKDQYGWTAKDYDEYIAYNQKVLDAYKVNNVDSKKIKALEEAIELAKKRQAELLRVTPEDIRESESMIEGWKDDVKSEFEAYMAAFGIKYGESANKNLSALQQGIQGVTEDTAGAIEAYMNIVAQRVFEQNLYLQEIRDHLNNFDLDVQLGTLSQMLLQLQQSYQVQQNIESILTGVLNPSGRAIVVELNS